MKSIHVNATTVSVKNGNTIKELMHTNIAFDSDTTFEGLLGFQKDAKKLFQKVLKAAKSGQSYEYTVTVLTYKEGTMELKDSNVWYANSYEGEDRIGTDDNGKEYLYLSPDLTATESYWDMCMYADVMRSLAEAHL